jgi:hypothetical protein
MDHILLGCSFSREVWESWIMRLHLYDMVVVREEPVMLWWLQSRKMVPKPIRRGFDSLFFLIGWMIWKELNTRTFNGVATSAVRMGVMI